MSRNVTINALIVISILFPWSACRESERRMVSPDAQGHGLGWTRTYDAMSLELRATENPDASVQPGLQSVPANLR
jgi:hypothetical protein